MMISDTNDNLLLFNQVLIFPSIEIIRIYKMSVVITSPHALCDPATIKSHYCDVIAKNMAVKLTAILQPIAQITYLEGNVPRRDCDLNRVVCRDTPYHQR